MVYLLIVLSKYVFLNVLVCFVFYLSILLCFCVWVCVCLCVCVCACTCRFFYLYVCEWVWVFVCFYIYVCVWVCVCVCVCLWGGVLYMNVCVCVRVCVCVCVTKLVLARGHDMSMQPSELWWTTLIGREMPQWCAPIKETEEVRRSHSNLAFLPLPSDPPVTPSSTSLAWPGRSSTLITTKPFNKHKHKHTADQTRGTYKVLRDLSCLDCGHLI